MNCPFTGCATGAVCSPAADFGVLAEELCFASPKFSLIPELYSIHPLHR